MKNFKKFSIFIACLLVFFNLGIIFAHAAFECCITTVDVDDVCTGSYSTKLECETVCSGTCGSSSPTPPTNFSVLLVKSEALTKYKFLQALPGYEFEAGQTNLENYLSWLYRFALAAAAFLAFLMMVIGGIQIIVGGASETARSDGKKKIEDAIWGLLLAVSAWLILYSINPQLVGMNSGPSSIAPVTVTGTGTKLSGDLGTLKTFLNLQKAKYNLINIKNLKNLEPLITEAAVNARVDPERLASIIMIESSGNTNSEHLDKDGKKSYGLGQVKIAAAKEMDSSISSWPDSKIAEKLKNDPKYNIDLAAKYYAKALEKAGGNKDAAIAYYNGGKAAIQPSRDCSGQLAYQCQWDNKAHTKPNIGYQVTRDYIVKMKLIEGKVSRYIAKK